MSTVRAAVSLILAFSVPTLAMSAHAADETREVRYGDLDLSTSRGVATLTRRIKIAAASICGPQMKDLKLASLWQQCQTATIASTTQSVQLAIAKTQGNQQAAVAGSVVAAR